MIRLLTIPVDLILLLEEKIGKLFYAEIRSNKEIKFVHEDSESIMDQISFTSKKHKGSGIIIFKDKDSINIEEDPIRFIRFHIDELD